MAQLFTDLAEVLRETGYPVVEVGDWHNHHHGALANHVGVIVWHHTAGPEPEETSNNYPSLNVVRWGRAGLPGPLSNIGMGYDGTLYVISAGTCYHAGTGGWNGYSGNSTSLGIEAEDAGDGDWTDAQLDCYPRVGAVLSQYLGEGAVANCGHKEWAPNRKIDPAGIDMGWARSQVQWYLDNPGQINRNAGDGDVPAEALKDTQMDKTLLPQSSGEWNTVAFSVESGNTSAMVQDEYLAIGSAYGSTDIVVVFEGYGSYHWPSWIKDGFYPGDWNDGKNPGNVPSGQSFRCKLTQEMEVVSVHYRNNGGAVAGVQFPKIYK